MTEPERLRAHARRSLEFADAIADQEAARALKAYAAELAPGGRADRGKGGRRRRGEHGGGTGRSGGEHHDSHGARPRDRPGSERITGVFFDFPDFRTKWLELLREVIPGLASIALLWDPASGVAQLEALQAAGDQLRLKARTLKVSAVGELEEAFATASRDGVDALLVLSSPLFGARPSVLAGLALRHKLPTVTSVSRFRSRRRADRLRAQSARHVSSAGPVGRQDSPWRKTGRFAGRATEQIRAGRQRKDRQGNRGDDSDVAPAARRRGDRMIRRREFVTLLGGRSLRREP